MINYKLSVALVTRNRPESLTKTLKSLREQSVQPFEVIISDDSDLEEAIKQNRELAEKYECKYIKGPQKGLYANRNFIAKVCKGTYIRTMDDDHTFPPDHFKTCLEKIREDPKSIWIIGEIYPNGVPQPVPPPCPGEIHPRGFGVKPKDEQNCRAISCGASIYPRTIIDNNILNVEYFKFGYTFFEYGSRLKHLGYRIRFLNETYIYHEYYSNPSSFNNEIAIMDSKIFAMMTLSFLYETSLKNQLYTTAQLTFMLFKNYKATRISIIENIKRIKELKEGLERRKPLPLMIGIYSSVF
jgi:glycosyltransferase involved in cell wall biosynthesis